ncbi:MAG: NAD(P)H-hydrate dehydratase [Ruminococcaceae bacterium]|nr:NAD(P)H-hydrate dehydratase [Oscillospiraceae bacterium]
MKIWYPEGTRRSMSDIEVTILNEELVRDMAPARPASGHKGTFGTALVTAGSEYMPGACVLACGAALRSGCGLVRVFSEKRTLDAVGVTHPCALQSLRDGMPTAVLRTAGRLIESADSVLIGPGMPADDLNIRPLLELFIRKNVNLVIDAGALSAAAHDKEHILPMLRHRETPAVLTPHPGEFARISAGVEGISPDDSSETAAVKLAAKLKSVIVLKNSRTVIAMPDGRLFKNETENDGLAKGGSGDVLAGLAAGLLAQGATPEKAACAAVWIHSQAGLAASAKYGRRAMLPSDLEEFLPDAFTKAGWNS